MEHNITIKQSELTAESQQISLSASKWAYAPEISATNSYTLSTGRVLDPTTYDFVENQTVSGNNTSVGASVMLFGGMRNLRNLQRARLDLRATLLDAEKTRNDVRLNVTAYYLEILCAEENIRNAEQIVETLRLQEDKTEKLVDARKVTAADLLQIQAELAGAENTLSTARNAYDIARLNICQLLEIEDWASFQTARPEGEIEYLPIEAEAVFESAQSLPEIGSARLGIDIARRDLQIARSAYYPTLSVSAGYGSSYSDVRQKMFQNPDGTLRYDAYPFFAQYRDNASGYLSVSLNIPIFGRLSVRKNVQMQKVTVRQAEYALQTVEKQVRREVTQARIDARTAWEKYLSSQKFVASAQEAARQMERKYNLGAATVLDYNVTLGTLVEAQSQLLQAKYEYLFKTEIIRFYLER
jgi:outer membrane protein